MTDNYDMKVILDVTNHGMEAQAVGIKSLKETASVIFGASSLLVALMGISLVPESSILPDDLILYRTMVVGVMVLFPLLIFLCLWVQTPAMFHGPIVMDWDILVRAFDGKEDRAILEQQIWNNLVAHSKNKKILMRRRWLTIIAGFIMILMVLLIVGINLIQRI
jgi:hypothetical protein